MENHKNIVSFQFLFSFQHENTIIHSCLATVGIGKPIIIISIGVADDTSDWQQIGLNQNPNILDGLGIK